MEQEIKFTVKTTAKLQTEKQRDPRPSVWLSVFKWLFAGFLSISFLVCVVTSKISLLAIGMYYNGTRIPHKSNLGINPASKETTFIMMVLILMIPQSLCLVKACWVSLFRSSHPWPSNSAIIWCLIAGLMEVTGLSFLVTVIVLQSTLTAPHCILIMNALFLIPIIWQLIELRVRIRDKRWTFTFLALAFMLEIIGISLLTYHVIKKENYPEFAGIPASLILLSLAWCPKIQKLQTVPRLNDKINDDNGSVQSKEEETGPSTADPKPANTNYAEDDLGNKTTAREKSTVISRFWKLLTPYVTVRRNDNMNNHLIQMIALGGAQSTDEEAGPSNNNPEPANTNNAEDDHGNKKTARGKSTVISSFWKLLLTPFVAALFCYIFKVADLNALQKGFENFDKGHAIYHFVAQLCSSLLGYIFAKLACSMCIQRVAFALPLTLATPISVALIYIPSICATTAIPFTCNITDNNYVIPLAICLWIAQFLSTGFYVWKGQTFIMAKESSLFWLPYYNGAFLEQYLLLNRKNQITDEYQVNQREIAKKSCVYICTTMYHETENEMEQLLHSLHDIDMARQASESQFEAHILFDGAVKGDVLNDFVLQLIALVPKTLKVKIDRCMKIKTPYGLQLRWKLLGGMPFVIHLKDNLKVKNKKRWSQVMYMSYVLDYKEKMMDSNDDNTYILATDADVKFTHESVEALLDLMMRNPRVGAVCGRTHPLGSGPIVWYQVFDYAIGHWFQKVANHVLGSVLCSPGCFSVYRARAIREVLPIYVSGVNTSVDFLTKDMGEDRWLCTLMVQSGWRLEYCAAAEDSTYCPETFDEFFKQRRRWISSTIANLIQLIRKWRTTLENNDKISIFFIFYQALMVFSTIISPATVILVITGALHYAKIGKEDEVVTLVLLVLVTVGFACICLYTKQDFQLKVAKLLTIVFALIMAFATVGMAAQIATDLALRKKCLGLSKGALRAVNNYTTPSPTGELSKCSDDGLPADLSSLYLAGLVGIFLLAALMHPFEAYCLLHGVWYLFCLPSGYLLLIIYSVCNLTDRSWGTRETKAEKKSGDEVPWYKEIWNKLKDMCFCCRPEAKPEPPTQPVGNQQLETRSIGEEISSDSIFSDDDPSSEDNKSGSSAEAASSSPPPSPVPLPDPPKSAMKSKLRRMSSTDELEEEASTTKWRFPGEKKEVRLDPKLPKMSKMPVKDWLEKLPHILRDYKQNFEEHGYDNVSFIVGMTDKDLRSIGITNSGHLSQLAYLIEKLPPVSLVQDVPENVKDWLCELGLESYWDYFKNNGYTERRKFKHLKAMDTETLRQTLKEDMSMTKRAHVAKMIKAIKNLQYPTPAQKQILRARKAINKVVMQSLKEINQDEKFEYNFWKGLREACLLPESAIFGAVTALKEKLEDVRNSALMVFAIANAIWIIILVTLNKQEDRKLLGTNAIGFAFLAIFGFIFVIQFLTLIWHRLSTICHMLARAPWKRSPYYMSWSFHHADLPPPPTEAELQEIRRKNKQSKEQKANVTGEPASTSSSQQDTQV